MGLTERSFLERMELMGFTPSRAVTAESEGMNIDMSNEEILARIGRDVTDIYDGMLRKRDITIWMTKRLFDRLFPEQFLLQNDAAMMTLFGCSIKVMLFPCEKEQWIVGYEGTNERRN